MGSCCSCFKSKSHPETELTDLKNTDSGVVSGANKSYAFVISAKMSARTVNINDESMTVTGEGLTLTGVSIEQDAAYWEWHVEVINDGNGDGNANDDDEDFFDEGNALKFGVATKKNRKFYDALESNEDGDDENTDDGTKLMRAIPNVQNGDTIGIAVQQSDLPMVQFLLNGEPLHELAISRFRGMVFPSAFVKSGYRLKFVWDEDEFKEMSPHVRFGPLIPERGLI